GRKAGRADSSIRTRRRSRAVAHEGPIWREWPGLLNQIQAGWTALSSVAAAVIMLQTSTGREHGRVDIASTPPTVGRGGEGRSTLTPPTASRIPDSQRERELGR